jgi:subtilisin family serine protease
MGVIVGGGAGGTTLGVAPDARWIAAKIFDDRGRSSVARIHAALQWLLDPDGRPGTADAPQVVNASWDGDGAGCDLRFEADLRHLRAAGIVPVFASGNDAHDVSPANNPSAFAVGSVDGAGGIAPGSGRGRSLCGGPVYPNLVAPGVDIPTTDVAGLYSTQTGTSVAAPHVSGALALLLSRFPRTSALRQQSALEAGAVDLGAPGPDSVFGSGRLDVAASYHWLVSARDLTLTPERWSITARAGGTASLRVKLGAVHGFTGPVRLAVTGLPRGVSAGVVRTTLSGASRPLRLSLATTRAVKPGAYPVTVVATAPARSRRLAVELVVRRG